MLALRCKQQPLGLSVPRVLVRVNGITNGEWDDERRMDRLFKSCRFIQDSSFYSSLVILFKSCHSERSEESRLPGAEYARLLAALGVTKISYGKPYLGKATYGKPTCCATWRAGSRRPWSHSNAAWCFCRPPGQPAGLPPPGPPHRAALRPQASSFASAIRHSADQP